MSKIDKSLEEYKNWCSSLGILCADDINRAIAQGEINNIINLSETEDLVTVMTCNEIFDPGHPDTFFEEV